jgi:peptide/nickel transport system substrate-binding protein
MARRPDPLRCRPTTTGLEDAEHAVRSTFTRLAAVLGALSVLLVSCTPGASDLTGPPEAPDPSDGAAEPPADPASVSIGMFQDMASESWWAYLDDADVWSGYVLDGSACQLYELTPPTFAVTPQLATHDWPEPRADGDTWIVEVAISDAATWSDGVPVTAHDVVFTWETVVGLPLGGQWLTYYEPAALDAGSMLDIEAVDDTTVRIRFADRPGLGSWPMAVALASIMPAHHWREHVDAADGPADLLATSGAGSPTCGAFRFVEREEGAFARVAANHDWFLAGTEYTHYADGTVQMVNDRLGIDGRFGESTGDGVDDVIARHTSGPYVDEIVYTLYGSAAVGVTALVEGEIAFLLTGLGVEAAAQDQIFDAEDVTAVVNANYGMQFLGFNLERSPMDDPAFREAVATVVDRAHITDTVMGGSAFPLYTRMPPGNAAWFDDSAGGAIIDRWSGFDNQAQRVEQAVGILAEAGYTWDAEPVVDVESGEIVERGQGIRGPDGQPIERLELLHPTAAYDPLRNTAGLFLAQFIGDLGIEVATAPTEFSQLVSRVIDPSDLRYDMAVLGWGLGNPALPTYYDAFWRSSAPLNITGYASDDYDDAVARFMAADDLAEAHRILWSELEPILDRDLPYVPLFDTPKVEGYRPELIGFPYTEVLGGLSDVGGMRGAVATPR